METQTPKPTEEEKRRLKRKIEQADADRVDVIKKKDRNPFSYVAIMVVFLLLFFYMCTKTCKRIERSLNEWSFCPYVYSYDGRQYRLDSETYAFAESKERERTEYDVLDHLKSVDGTYRLMLTNDHHETQYTNELKLLLVDHPKGTTVIPDSMGRIHTIRQPYSPIASLAENGSNALELVNSEDGIFWECDLPDGDLTRDENLRDGLTLEFEKPEGARIARIAVNGYNTPLIIHVWRDIQAEAMGKRYADMDGGTAKSREMSFANLKELMLQVKVWQNNQWIVKGAFPNPGSAVTKKQVILLDVSEVQEDRLRFKLESVAGLWKIDGVLADYSDDAGVRLTELACESAVAHNGSDISAELDRTDNSYYTTVRGDSAHLTFNEIPGVSGCDRTHILKIRGYYEPEMLEKYTADP